MGQIQLKQIQPTTLPDFHRLNYIRCFHCLVFDSKEQGDHLEAFLLAKIKQIIKRFLRHNIQRQQIQMQPVHKKGIDNLNIFSMDFLVFNIYIKKL